MQINLSSKMLHNRLDARQGVVLSPRENGAGRIRGVEDPGTHPTGLRGFYKRLIYFTSKIRETLLL